MTTISAIVLGAALLAGCGGGGMSMTAAGGTGGVVVQKVPEPLHLLLPDSIRIHPFTGTRTFDEQGGIKGIEVRVEALDAYGDPTKAFGDWHFSLHAWQAGVADNRGKQVATWEEPLLTAQKNLLHWDSITRTYKFKLQWYKPIAVGHKFILTATFSSPFTERKFAQREFVAGQ